MKRTQRIHVFRATLLLVLSGIALLPGYAQQTQLDSLRWQLSQAADDTNKVNLYHTLFKLLSRNRNFESKMYADSMVALSNKLGYARGKIKGTMNQANYYLDMDSLEHARHHIMEIYSFCEQRSDTGCLKSAILSMASIEIKQTNLETGDSLLNIGAQMAEALRDTNDLTKIYINLAAIRYAAGEYKEVIALLLKAARLADDVKQENRNNQYLIHANLAAAYNDIQDDQKSIHHKRMALEYLHTENKASRFSLYSGLASSFLALNQPDSARTYLDRIEVKYLSDRSAHFYFMRRAQLAVAEESDSAFYFIGRSLDKAERIGDDIGIANCYEFYGRLYYWDEKFKEACRYNQKAIDKMAEYEVERTALYIGTLGRLIRSKIAAGICPAHEETEEYFHLRDSLFTAEKVSALSEMESQYQFEKKELENENLRQSNELQSIKLGAKNMQLGVAGTGLSALLLITGLLYRRSQEKARNAAMLEQKNQHIHTLNRELMHRTKNQIELAASLLGAYNPKGVGLSGADIVEASEARIRTLAAVNRRLTPENDFVRTNLRDTLQEVLEGNIFSLALAHGDAQVTFRLDMPDIILDAEKVTTIGLIINELSVNSLKYAFHGIAAPHIRVEGRLQNGRMELRYTDNGTGVSSTGSGGSQSGMGLVRDLVSQLGGESEVRSGEGVDWVIWVEGVA